LTDVACFLHVSAYASFGHAAGDGCGDVDVKCRPTSSLVFLADLTTLQMEIYAGLVRVCLVKDLVGMSAYVEHVVP
ncbi:hypothetical protein BHM03_00038343, partial [Ensete ventricosum]